MIRSVLLPRPYRLPRCWKNHNHLIPAATGEPDTVVEDNLVNTYFIQLPQDYKVVLLKNEFGDIEGAP